MRNRKTVAFDFEALANRLRSGARGHPGPHELGRRRRAEQHYQRAATPQALGGDMAYRMPPPAATATSTGAASARGMSSRAVHAAAADRLDHRRPVDRAAGRHQPGGRPDRGLAEPDRAVQRHSPTTELVFAAVSASQARRGCSTGSRCCRTHEATRRDSAPLDARGARLRARPARHPRAPAGAAAPRAGAHGGRAGRAAAGMGRLRPSWTSSPAPKAGSCRSAFTKVVQPADAGVVTEILVEGRRRGERGAGADAAGRRACRGPTRCAGH